MSWGEGEAKGQMIQGSVLTEHEEFLCCLVKLLAQSACVSGKGLWPQCPQGGWLWAHRARHSHRYSIFSADSDKAKLSKGLHTFRAVLGWLNTQAKYSLLGFVSPNRAQNHHPAFLTLLTQYCHAEKAPMMEE